jgi:hypothetical protein
MTEGSGGSRQITLLIPHDQFKLQVGFPLSFVGHRLMANLSG